MLQAVLDDLWTHERSRVPGASYTAPGPYFQGVDLKTWILIVCASHHPPRPLGALCLGVSKVWKLGGLIGEKLRGELDA